MTTPLTTPAVSHQTCDTDGPGGLGDLLTLALLTSAYHRDPASVADVYRELRPLARLPDDPEPARLARCIAAVEAVRLGRPLPADLDALDRSAVAHLLAI